MTHVFLSHLMYFSLKTVEQKENWKTRSKIIYLLDTLVKKTIIWNTCYMLVSVMQCCYFRDGLLQACAFTFLKPLVWLWQWNSVNVTERGDHIITKMIWSMKDAFSHIRTTGFIALNQLCELTLLITQHNQCQGLKDTDAYFEMHVEFSQSQRHYLLSSTDD